MSFQYSKPCPWCAARNSMEVDYNLGEVVCMACVKVVANGLQEDEQERFDKDGGTFMDAGQRHGAPSGGGGEEAKAGATTAISASALAPKAPLNPTLQRLLKSIRDRSGFPEDVKPAVKHLHDLYVGYKLSRSEPVEKKAVLLAACVIIATTTARFPVVASEINTYEKVATLHEMDRKVDEILQLASVVPALQPPKAAYALALKTLPDELAQLYLVRLQWSPALFAQPITLVVEALAAAVPGDRRPRPEELVALALVLLRIRGRVHDRFAATWPASVATGAQTDDQTIAEIASAVRLDVQELKRRKEKVVTSDVLTAIDALLKVRLENAAQVASAAAHPAVGTKRPRE